MFLALLAVLSLTLLSLTTARNTFIQASSCSLLPFLLYVAARLYFSPYEEWARREFVQYLSIFLCYESARSLKEDGAVILQSAAFGSAFYSALFIAFALSGRSVDALESEWILNTHVAGAFALLGLFAAWQLYDDGKSRVYWICGLVDLAALAFSKSWAAAAALIVGAGLAAYRKYAGDSLFPPRRAALTAAAFCAAFLILILPAKNATITDRLDWWRSAAELIVQNPLAGAGPYEKLSPFHADSRIRSPYAHNYILQMSAEYGLVAALFMTVFLVRKTGRSRHIVLGAGLAAAFAQNLMDFAMNIPGYLLIFFILLGTAEGGEPEPAGARRSETERGGTDRGAAARRILAGVFVIWAGWVLGIKPASAFYMASRAQDAAAGGNMEQAERYLLAAARRDPVRTDLEAQLCALAYERYRRGGSETDLEAAMDHGRNALAKDPLQKIYYLRMQTLIEERRRRFAAL